MIGLLTGALLPFVREGIGIARDWQDNNHELALLQAQGELQAKLGHTVLETTRVEAVVDDRVSVRKHDTYVMRRASRWVVDVNGLIRPLITLLALCGYFAGLFFLDYSFLASPFWAFCGGDSKCGGGVLV